MSRQCKGPGFCPSPACPCVHPASRAAVWILPSPLPACLRQIPSPPCLCQHCLTRIPQTSGRRTVICEVRKVGDRCPRPLLATNGSECGQAGCHLFCQLGVDLRGSPGTGPWYRRETWGHFAQ